MIKSILQVHGRTVLVCMAVSFVLYMTAAWRSAIYLHPDEYYQIVEFASYKMHITTPDQMAWEFGEKIRPALQPLMCYTFVKGFNLLHITDHYTQLYLLRVLSALLSLFSISLLCIGSLPLISESYRRLYILASFLFWYPYTYGVHFSSEAWSACVMMIAVSMTALYYQHEFRKGFLFFSVIGLLMGVAFLLRFQTAFISLGIVAWMIFEKKERWNILPVIAAGILVLLLGAVADHWLYGEWLCTPWRYFDSAFVHRHTEFGDQPFYFYPLLLTLMLTPPIGLLIVAALFIFFYTQPKTLYAWALLPFLLFHMIIGHKEFRFTYPVISFFPLVVVMAYQGLVEKKGMKLPKWLIQISKGFVIVFNVLCLIIFVFFANSFLFDSKIFCQRIHDMARDKNVVVYCKDINNSPYVLPKATIPKDLCPEYMRDARVSNVLIDDLKNVPASDADTIRLIATNEYEYNHAALPHRAENTCLQRTLTDLSFIKSIAGDEAYKSIEENTYYLIESK